MGALIDPATIAGYFQPECKRINLRAHAHLLPFGVETMKTEQIPTTTAADVMRDIRESIAFFDKQIEDAKCTLSSHGWVVTSRTMPLKFDVDPVTQVASNPRVTGWRGGYSRLTREDAEALAPLVKNGNGEPAQAFPLVVALENARRESVAALSWAEDAVAKLNAG